LEIRESEMSKVALTLMMLAGMVILAGCNTVQGIGKDLEKAGEKIEKTAK
jgi:predicted small secreted protein